MKKIFAWLLVAQLALCGAALAEMDTLPGNIGGGGIAAAGADGTLYFAQNGLQCLDASGVRTIAEGEVLYLQWADGALYFVSSAEAGEDEYDAEYLDTLYRLDADGTLTAIGAPLRRGEDYDYSDDYHYALYNAFNGYGDMTVYGGHIYFIGNSGVGGEYETVAKDWGEAPGEARYSTRYTSGACVYRMDLDGGNLTELISGLGNGWAHLAICNERIAVASCFQNAVFAYDFYNFMLYDLDGNLLEIKANHSESRHSNLYKEDQEFTVIVNSIQTDGETIYASLGDSEGDFASSRFVDVEDVDATIAYEAYYTPSLWTDDGLIYLRSDVQDVFWDEAMENSIRLVRRDAAGEEQLLAYVPASYLHYEMALALTGGDVYLRTEGHLLRVNLESGDVDEFDGAQFAVCPPCDPAFAGGTKLMLTTLEPTTAEDAAVEQGDYLLPDSDTRLYTREELSQYDKDTLALMRNEILARHGYPFQKEKYQSYFGAKSWYAEDPNFSYDSLNSTEMANVETIKGLE